MNKAILYYLAAGALFGGPATAVLLFRRGHQEAAIHLQARDHRNVAALVRIQIEQMQLHAQARAVGVDPDLAAKAYGEMREGLVTIPQILTWLRTLGHG